MTQKEPFSPQRALWRLICLLLALVLAAMTAATALFQYLLAQIQCSPEDSVPTFSLTADSLRSFADPSDVNWKQLGADLTKKDKKAINILLIGQDRREDGELSRADSMILCTFDRTGKKLTMTSFLRDTYIPIPGHGKDRLNAAYAYGGTALLKQTLEETIEITIDGTIEADFSQFAVLVDTLGGVDITLRQDEAEHINQVTGSTLSEGLQHLTGAEALAYSRIRSLDPDGDFSRTGRQRKVLSAIVDAYRGTGVPVLLKLLKEVLPLLSTDMTESRLLLLAMEIFPMLSGMEIAAQSLPAPEHCNDETINGMAVLVPDLEALRNRFHETTKSE